MRVIVDTSAWINYFKTRENDYLIDELLETGTACVNPIIRLELLPNMYHKNEKHLAQLFESLPNIGFDTNWDELVNWRTELLRNGLNGVGIPDLLIAQQAKQNDFPIYSFDKHFKLLSELLHIPVLL